MADKTNIEWTDATWNPIRGCSRVSEGCRYCYAENVAARVIAMDRGRQVPEGNGAYDGLLAKGGQWNGAIKTVDSVLDQPLRWQKSRLIFVNSMSDLFHENVSEQAIDRIFVVMALAAQHTFQVLTKRPQRMKDYLCNFSWERAVENCRGADGVSDILRHSLDALRGSFGLRPRRPSEADRSSWPVKNVWLGVSVENQETANERIPLLLQSPAAVRWLSMEPLLGPVDLLATPAGDILCRCGGCTDMARENPSHAGLQRIDWVVVGGESGRDARPMNPNWVVALRDQCSANGVPFLFKQWGEWRPPLDGEEFSTAMGRAQRVPAFIVAKNGTVHCFEGPTTADGALPMLRVGKQAAGRLLDGQLFDGYPTTLDSEQANG